MMKISRNTKQDIMGNVEADVCFSSPRHLASTFTALDDVLLLNDDTLTPGHYSSGTSYSKLPTSRIPTFGNPE
jgi:hypothetical protein